MASISLVDVWCVCGAFLVGNTTTCARICGLKLGEKLDDKIEEVLGDKLAEKADIESPEFAGVPTTPTAAASNSIKQDEYIKSLEQKILDLENKLAALVPEEETTNE